jgi:hypothetical protein
VKDGRVHDKGREHESRFAAPGCAGARTGEPLPTGLVTDRAHD